MALPYQKITFDVEGKVNLGPFSVGGKAEGFVGSGVEGGVGFTSHNDSVCFNAKGGGGIGLGGVLGFELCMKKPWKWFS